MPYQTPATDRTRATDPTRSSRTPGERFIDPRAQRFGAGVSATLLVAAFLADAPAIAVAIGVNLAVSAAFGTRYFLPARPWRTIRAALSLGPFEPEHDYPPRFAQALGATMLAAAALAFVVGAPTVGWAFAGVVAALQLLLATTGICVGCRMYFLRWWIPDRFARLVGRSERLLPGAPIRLQQPDA
ncbi:MAG: hypothetical protein RL338_868 [Chloroflexota bacterium]|jgi:hypothetical protein